MQGKGKNVVKKVVDAVMVVFLIFLIAYQATGEKFHEWLGVATVVVWVLHHALNVKWITSLFKGKYSAFRVLTVVTNAALLVSVLLTALCGMAMSAHATPFLYGVLPVAFAHEYHLAMSFWTFILAGLHLGLHVPGFASWFRLSDRVKTILAATFSVLSGVGFWLAVKNRILDYIFFRQPFPFFDYEKSAVLVLVENLAILAAFTFLGASCASLVKPTKNTSDGGKRKATTAVLVLVAVLIGVALTLCREDEEEPSWGDAASERLEIKAVELEETRMSFERIRFS